MALRPCIECGQSISTSAKTCPRCGKASPHKRSGLLNSPLALGGLGMLVVGFVALAAGGGKPSTSSVPTDTAAMATTEAAAPHVRDSARVATLLAHHPLPLAEALEADRVIHSRDLSIAHDSVHRMAVAAHLDSAAALLTPRDGGIGLTSSAKEHLALIEAPLTPAQTKRQAQLRAALATQEARTAAWAKKEAAKLMISQRRRIAEELETTYLDKGLNVTVTAVGPAATTLRIKWILVSKVAAHEMSKNAQLFENLRRAEFRRLELTDGYDETWYWNLAP